MDWVYADNNATTAVAPEVVAAMEEFFRGRFFNPSSMYGPALEVAGAVKASRTAEDAVSRRTMSPDSGS